MNLQHMGKSLWCRFFFIRQINNTASWSALTILFSTVKLFICRYKFTVLPDVYVVHIPHPSSHLLKGSGTYHKYVWHRISIMMDLQSLAHLYLSGPHRIIFTSMTRVTWNNLYVIEKKISYLQLTLISEWSQKRLFCKHN